MSNESERMQTPISVLLYASSQGNFGVPGNFAKAELSNGRTTASVTFHFADGKEWSAFEDTNWQHLGLDPKQIMSIVDELQEQALQIVRLRRKNGAKIGAMVVVIDRADAP